MSKLLLKEREREYKKKRYDLHIPYVVYVRVAMHRFRKNSCHTFFFRPGSSRLALVQNSDASLNYNFCNSPNDHTPCSRIRIHPIRRSCFNQFKGRLPHQAEASVKSPSSPSGIAGGVRG